jgi:hypothetical protein
MTEFPPNSNLSKDAKLQISVKKSPAKKVVEKVVEGKVVQRKTPLSRRFVQAFFNTEEKNIREYILIDLLVPYTQDICRDITNGVLDRVFPGSRRSTNARPNRYVQPGGYGHISYNQVSRQAQQSPTNPGISRQARAQHDFSELLFEHRYEADTVLERLYDMLSNYEVVSVKDLYDLVGLDSEHTDYNWGWTALAGSRIVNSRGQYWLDLPRPEPIKP